MRYSSSPIKSLKTVGPHLPEICGTWEIEIFRDGLNEYWKYIKKTNIWFLKKKPFSDKQSLDKQGSL